MIAIVKNGAITNAQSMTSAQVIFTSSVAGLTSAAALIQCNGSTDTISVQVFSQAASGTVGATNAASSTTINAEMVISLLSGSVGATGPTGGIGPTGNAGATGTAGSATNTGATGPSGPTGPAAIGAPNSQSAAYTTVLSDANGIVLHPTADTTARTFTIAANSSVPYPVGTAITFVNQTGAGVLTISINTDSLFLAGAASTSGSRTLTAYGIATAVKITSTQWVISGPGLT
jgi:hypothetical protein